MLAPYYYESDYLSLMHASLPSLALYARTCEYQLSITSELFLVHSLYLMAYFEGELSGSGGVEFYEPLMCPLSTRGRNVDLREKLWTKGENSGEI